MCIEAYNPFCAISPPLEIGDGLAIRMQDCQSILPEFNTERRLKISVLYDRHSLLNGNVQWLHDDVQVWLESYISAGVLC